MKVAGTCQGNGAGSCPQPTAPEVAAEKSVEELEMHHVKQDTLHSGACSQHQRRWEGRHPGEPGGTGAV